jgi:hypothetical protein
MPKTKKRGGAKAHRKRIQTRNNTIEGVRNQMQKMWEQEMNARLEMLRKSAEGSDTDATTVTNLEIPNIQLPNDDENTPIEIKL